jgi:hypothetical protein
MWHSLVDVSIWNGLNYLWHGLVDVPIWNTAISFLAWKVDVSFWHHLFGHRADEVQYCNRLDLYLLGRMEIVWSE